MILLSSGRLVLVNVLNVFLCFFYYLHFLMNYYDQIHLLLSGCGYKVRNEGRRVESSICSDGWGAMETTAYSGTVNSSGNKQSSLSLSHDQWGSMIFFLHQSGKIPESPFPQRLLACLSVLYTISFSHTTSLIKHLHIVPGLRS